MSVDLPGFEAELIHGSNSSDEIVLSVFGTVFPLLQHRSHCKHQEEQKVTQQATTEIEIGDCRFTKRVSPFT